MNKYTVLLLRPEYMADNFGQDTYLAHVEALDVLSAQELAQWEANLADTPPNTGDHDPGEAADYHVLAVFKGHLDDMKEET